MLFFNSVFVSREVSIFLSFDLYDSPHLFKTISREGVRAWVEGSKGEKMSDICNSVNNKDLQPWLVWPSG